MADLPMTTCFFASDLHGMTNRYRKLFAAIETAMPGIVFLGDDLLPSFLDSLRQESSTRSGFYRRVSEERVYAAQGNIEEPIPFRVPYPRHDDPRSEETAIEDAGNGGLWSYLHNRIVTFAPSLPCEGRTPGRCECRGFGEGCVASLGLLLLQDFKSLQRFGVIGYDHERLLVVLDCFGLVADFLI